MDKSSAIPSHLWLYERQMRESMEGAFVRELNAALDRYYLHCGGYPGAASLVTQGNEVADGLRRYVAESRATDDRVRQVGDGFANTDSSQLPTSELTATGYEQLVSVDDAQLAHQIEAVAHIHAMWIGHSLAQAVNGPDLSWREILADAGSRAKYHLDDPYVMAGFLQGLSDDNLKEVVNWIRGEGPYVPAEVNATARLMARAWGTSELTSEFTGRFLAITRGDTPAAFDAGLAGDWASARAFLNGFPNDFGYDNVRTWVAARRDREGIALAASLNYLAGHTDANVYSEAELRKMAEDLVDHNQGAVLASATQSWITSHAPAGGASVDEWTTFSDEVARVTHTVADPTGKHAAASAEQQKLLLNIAYNVAGVALAAAPEFFLPVEVAQLAGRGLDVAAAVGTPFLPLPDGTKDAIQAQEAALKASQACVVAAMLHNGQIVGVHSTVPLSGDAGHLIEDVINNPNRYEVLTSEGPKPASAVIDHISGVFHNPQEH